MPIEGSSKLLFNVYQGPLDLSQHVSSMEYFASNEKQEYASCELYMHGLSFILLHFQRVILQR